MTDAWVAFWAALGGSVVGAIATMAGLVVQSIGDRRKHRQEMALKMATDDRALHMEKASPGAAIPPLAVYIHYYLNVIDEISKGKLNEASLNRIGDENQEVFEAIRTRQEKR